MEQSGEADTEASPDLIEPYKQDIFDDKDKDKWWDKDKGKKVAIGSTFNARRMDTPLDKIIRRQSGRRSRTHTDRKRGRYIQSRSAEGKTDDLAFDATIRAAAPFQRERKSIRKRVAFAIRSNDYMRKVRVRRSANLILFLVDASWSMAVTERMEATKGAILSLLNDAYQRRDRVGLIIFQKDSATMILQPTNSILLAHKALVNIPVGGKTPLSAGLTMAYEVLHKEKILRPDVQPLLVVLTDGAGNVSMGHLPPQEEAHRIAQMIAFENIHSVVINMEHAAFDQGLAQALADKLEAPCYSIGDIKAENLYRAVKQEMKTAQMPAGDNN